MTKSALKRKGKRVIDISKQRFGFLSVKSLQGTSPELGALWLCRCACGNYVVLPRGCLVRKVHPRYCCGTKCPFKRKNQNDVKLLSLAAKLRNRGLSYRDIADKAGCSLTKVWILLNYQRQE